MVEKSLRGGHGEVIEVAGIAGVDIGVKGCADLGWAKLARLRDWECEKVYGDLAFRKGDVAGDGVGSGTICAPMAAVLRGTEDGNSEGEREAGEEEDSFIHYLKDDTSGRDGANKG